MWAASVENARDFSRKIWIAAIVTIAATTCLFLIAGWQSYRSVEADARARLAAKATLAEAQVAGLVRNINATLDQVLFETARKGHCDQQLIEHLVRLYPELRSLTVIDRQGIYRCTSLVQFIGLAGAAQDHIKRELASPHANVLIIEKPAEGRLTGVPILFIHKTAVSPAGRPEFIAQVSIDLRYFDALLESLRDKTQTVSLLHDSGLMISRTPDPDKFRFRDLSKSATAFDAHRRSGDRLSTHKLAVAADGVGRFVAIADVVSETMALPPRGKLLVSVSETMADVYAGWVRLEGLLVAAWLLLVAATIVLARQVAKGKRNEALLLATQGQLEATIDAIPDLMLELGLDGTYHAVHAPRQGLPVAPPSHPLGARTADVFPPVANEVIMSALHEAHGIGSSHGKQFELSLPQGDFWFELSVARKQVDRGQKPRFVLLLRDITERRRAEQNLRIAATAFESGEGMLVTDARGVMLRVNRAFTEITGYTAEEAIGQTPRLLKSGRHDHAFYAALWESIERGGAWQGEIWNRRKNSEVYPEWLMITAVKDAAGNASHYVGTFTDITSRKIAEDEIRTLAFYDPLTQLPNRRLLLDRLQQALASSTRSERYGALLFIDLDNFKTLNDTLGHDIGDLLLTQVAKRLTTCVREGDTVARLGGDEFVVMLEDLSGIAQEAARQAEAVGEKVLFALTQTYQLASYEYHGTPSIGVTLFADHHDTVDELLRWADLAMYQAKSAGRNTLRFFDPEMQAAVMNRAALEAGLREALLKNQFFLCYQAQVDGEGYVTGAEALLRWQHPERGVVSPLEFISLAEDTGLILPLGQWVLEAVCAQLAVWAVQPETAHLTVAANVSARQFRHRDFVDQVVAAVGRTGAKPQQLKLELTESLLVDDVEDTITKMTALKAHGISFSLDDFGTGYSSLSYLKRLPLDQLKIDQSFVRDVLTDPNDAEIARTIIALGKALDLAVIAEGVENQGQRDFLAASGCHAYQGYLYSKPLPPPGFEEFVRQSASRRRSA